MNRRAFMAALAGVAFYKPPKPIAGRKIALTVSNSVILPGETVTFSGLVNAGAITQVVGIWDGLC